ncbi:MAG: nicotinamide mononucleotide transporter [Flavobacteriales bacterium]|nr:nicotinamide mononucleotide transporter [Flavobacteriales bacterium]
MAFDLYTGIELVSVLFSVFFLVLLMRQSIWCWPFGIVGSALGVVLFVSPEAAVNLYSEAILYSYYVWIGIYGWIRWSSKSNEKIAIVFWSSKAHIIAIGLGLILAPALGYFMNTYTESNSPYIDAFTTVFSFIASYMQARKVMSSWHFWIVINAVSIGLYYSRDLYLYTGLMVVYFALSIVGLIQWKKDNSEEVTQP